MRDPTELTAFVTKVTTIKSAMLAQNHSNDQFVVDKSLQIAELNNELRRKQEHAQTVTAECVQVGVEGEESTGTPIGSASYRIAELIQLTREFAEREAAMLEEGWGMASDDFTRQLAGPVPALWLDWSRTEVQLRNEYRALGSALHKSGDGRGVPDQAQLKQLCLEQLGTGYGPTTFKRTQKGSLAVWSE